MKIKIKKSELKKQRVISKHRPKVQTNKKVYKRGEVKEEDFNRYIIDTNIYN